MESANDKTSGQSGAGMKSSLHALITARLTLIKLELKQALKDRARTLASLLIAAMMVFFAWLLLLAGGIAAIAAAAHWPWHLVALGFATLHLLVAVLLVLSTSGSKSKSFPVTRSEFKKDCEWLESLQNKPKSNS